jgi:hypothetical protein
MSSFMFLGNWIEEFVAPLARQERQKGQTVLFALSRLMTFFNLKI